jgi:NifU-like protein involved in Fe-S cluster formation
MTLEVVGGKFDGKKVVGDMMKVTWIVNGVEHTVIEFKHGGQVHKILIPDNAIPSEAISNWLDRHA